MKYLTLLILLILTKVSLSQGFIEDPVYDSLINESKSTYDTTFVDYFIHYKPKYDKNPCDYTNIYIYHCTFVDNTVLEISYDKLKHSKNKENGEVIHKYTKSMVVNGMKIKASLFKSRLNYGYRVKYKNRGKWKDVIPLNLTEKNGHLIVYNDVINEASTQEGGHYGPIKVYKYFGYNSYTMKSSDDMEEKLSRIAILWYLSIS